MAKIKSFCVAFILCLTSGLLTVGVCTATKGRSNPKGSKAARLAEAWTQKQRNAAEKNHQKQTNLYQEIPRSIPAVSDTQSLLNVLIQDFKIPIGLAMASIFAYAKYCAGDFNGSVAWLQAAVAENLENQISTEAMCSEIPEIDSCTPDQIYNFYEFCCDCSCNIEALQQCLPSFASIAESIKAAFEYPGDFF